MNRFDYEWDGGSRQFRRRKAPRPPAPTGDGGTGTSTSQTGGGPPDMKIGDAHSGGNLNAPKTKIGTAHSGSEGGFKFMQGNPLDQLKEKVGLPFVDPGYEVAGESRSWLGQPSLNLPIPDWSSGRPVKPNTARATSTDNSRDRKRQAMRDALLGTRKRPVSTGRVGIVSPWMPTITPDGGGGGDYQTSAPSTRRSIPGFRTGFPKTFAFGDRLAELRRGLR